MSSTLSALSPLDGRYAAKVAALRPIFGEAGLMQRRVLVEVRWLLALAEEPGIVEVAPFSAAAREALLAVATRGRIGESYNIGGGVERTNIDVVRAICAMLDEMRPDPAGQHARLITHVADRPGHDARYAIDAGKISRELGWAPKESFETGLRRTIAWFLDNPGWWGDIRSGVYRGERLAAG